MKNNFITEIKLAITAFFAALTSLLGTLAIPMYILVMLNVVDYFTGWSAAPYRGQKRNSNRGFMGIVKKVCMWLLVGVGVAVDTLLMYTGETLGITLPFSFLVSIAVAVWLICNEIISILENMGDIGVELPGFLMTLVRWIKATTEDKADITKGGSSNE